MIRKISSLVQSPTRDFHQITERTDIPIGIGSVMLTGTDCDYSRNSAENVDKLLNTHFKIKPDFLKIVSDFLHSHVMCICGGDDKKIASQIRQF